MSDWPALGTVRGGHRALRWYHPILAALGTILLTAVGGAALLWLAPPPAGDDAPSLARLVGGAAVFSPLYAWLGFLIGVPVSLLAMRAGRAGWAVALIAGAAAGAVIGTLLGGAVVLVFFGTLEAGLYWLILRRLAPSALAPREAG